MIDARRRRKILSRGKPEKTWAGEPGLGSWYTDEEVAAAVAAIRSSMHWTEGFGFIVEEITAFEQAFADYVGTAHAVSVSTASVGLDLAMRCLDLEPGDEVICPAVNFRAAPLAVLGQGGCLVFAAKDANHAVLWKRLDGMEARLAVFQVLLHHHDLLFTQRPGGEPHQSLAGRMLVVDLVHVVASGRHQRSGILIIHASPRLCSEDMAAGRPLNEGLCFKSEIRSTRSETNSDLQ